VHPHPGTRRGRSCNANLVQPCVRWKPLAFDVNGDVAAVVRRDEGQALGRLDYRDCVPSRGNRWVHIGSSGGSTGAPTTASSRLVPRRPRAGSYGRVEEALGSTRLPGGRSAVVTRGTACSRHPRASHMFEVHGSRAAAADHGVCCVVWRGRTMPAITLLDADGRHLERVTARDLSILRRMPLSACLYRRLTSRSHRGEWFNYAPGRP